MKEQMSKCCKAPVTLEGRGDFHDKDEVCTMHHQCSDCQQPCDLWKPIVLPAPLYNIGDKVPYLLEEGSTREEDYYGLGTVKDMHYTAKDGWSYFLVDKMENETGRWQDEDELPTFAKI